MCSNRFANRGRPHRAGKIVFGQNLTGEFTVFDKARGTFHRE
jgi:hypothetical protein